MCPSVMVLLATFVAVGVLQWPLMPVVLVVRADQHCGVLAAESRAMRDNPLVALIIIIAPLSLLAIGGASSIYAPLQHQTVDIHQWISGPRIRRAVRDRAGDAGAGLDAHDADRLARCRACRRAGGDALALHPLLGAVLLRSRIPGTAIAAPPGIPRSRMGCARSRRA